MGACRTGGGKQKAGYQARARWDVEKQRHVDGFLWHTQCSTARTCAPVRAAWAALPSRCARPGTAASPPAPSPKPARVAGPRHTRPGARAAPRAVSDALLEPRARQDRAHRRLKLASWIKRSCAGPLRSCRWQGRRCPGPDALDRPHTAAKRVRVRASDSGSNSGSEPLASLPFRGVRVDTTLFDQQGLCHTPGAPRLSSSDLSSSSSGECRNSPSFARPPCHTSCRTRRAPASPRRRRCMSAAPGRARARRRSRAPYRCLRAGADRLASVHTCMEQHRGKEHRPWAGHAACEDGGLQPDSAMTLSTLPPPSTPKFSCPDYHRGLTSRPCHGPQHKADAPAGAARAAAARAHAPAAPRGRPRLRAPRARARLQEVVAEPVGAALVVLLDDLAQAHGVDGRVAPAPLRLLRQPLHLRAPPRLSASQRGPRAPALAPAMPATRPCRSSAPHAGKADADTGELVISTQHTRLLRSPLPHNVCSPLPHGV